MEQWLYGTLAALPDLHAGDVHTSDVDTRGLAQNGKPGFAGLSKSSGRYLGDLQIFDTRACRCPCRQGDRSQYEAASS